MSKTVGIRELKQKTGELVRRASCGEHIMITDHNRPVAEIVPVKDSSDRPPALNLPPRPTYLIHAKRSLNNWEPPVSFTEEDAESLLQHILDEREHERKRQASWFK